MVKVKNLILKIRQLNYKKRNNINSGFVYDVWLKKNHKIHKYMDKNINRGVIEIKNEI